MPDVVLEKGASPSDLEKALAPAATPTEQVVVSALESYRMEADNVRKGGPNPRDDKWKENLDLYWNRFDFSKKADWQAQEVMPEVPGFVDRFAASLKEALVSSPDGFYTIVDPADSDQDITWAIKAMCDVWLSQCGRNQVGTPIGFPAVFEEQMKLGAIMACSSVVTWKEDVPQGRVSVETVDPRFVWLDHTYRNLYRIRRTELDKHDLIRMVSLTDGGGKSIYNLPQLDRLISAIPDKDTAEKERLSGVGTGNANAPSSRAPIVLDEYIATVLGPKGEILADEAMCVVANQQYLIRGPEKNPFWHGKDWLVYAPLVTVPLSVYGRSYMEDFGSVAKTFNDLTNLILDAVHVSALKAYVVVPGMLSNPGQLAEGISPLKIFQLEDGMRPEDFLQAIDMGTLPSEVVQVWDNMKNELREAAFINEIGMGQFAPNSRTSATEIVGTQQSSSAVIRSIAQTVETRYLDPVLDLVWKTGLQHVKVTNPTLATAVGEDLWGALYARRKELISRPVTLQARGISTLIQRGNMLKSMLQIISIIGANPILTQEFLGEVDLNKLIKLLFDLSNVPLHKLQLSERERMMRAVAGPLQAAAGPQGVGGSPGQGRNVMGSMAKSMGIARQQ